MENEQIKQETLITQCQLRFCRKSVQTSPTAARYVDVLQQAYLNTVTGTIVWKDVPTVRGGGDD
ncbi:hypothetical protein FHQ28_08620 [Pasteurellaceae bacterium USgator11]|nr:hypothetical protein FHQ20_11645 [Pasteurellaceae bacterium USgator41]TNG98685.1 hypothetical protein FHQ24_07830 [Pasteurellaceae bacterium UScroc31]TNH00052.1 hypothetical protein FHQ28_08620 [Pasteurellaceae bacterium USgator11]